MPTFRGDKNDVPGGCYGIVVSRYNESITSNLLAGAIDALKQAGVADDQIDVAWVPGAFEIPLAADQMAATNRYAAVLCLGAVIRGDTTHDQHINRAVSLGIMEANLRHGVPVLFGVLTCETFEQATQRAQSHKPNTDPKTAKKTVNNKGAECAEAALEMVSLLRKLEQSNDER